MNKNLINSQQLSADVSHIKSLSFLVHLVARSFSKRWFDCEALETLAEAARYEKFKDTRY